ncbi:MAG: acetyltransferase [Actinobacteria bacterium HGW-Actinobacteria-2]|nr:MAG: acetyltransferase [Actinobacteria bacterium HGW-Actinobacteria-2]
MTTALIVVGAGGFGRETLDIVEAINSASPGEGFDVIGVADDHPSELNLARLSARDYQWLGTIADVLATREPVHFALAVGNPSVRRELTSIFASAGWIAATLIHPRAVVGSASRIGAGCILCSGVQVSTNVVLGEQVHLNPNATVGHDAELSAYVSVNPGAIISGEVQVDSDVLIGAGAVVLQGLSVGSGAIVGAGACVTKDVAAASTVVGVPAHPLHAKGE